MLKNTEQHKKYWKERKIDWKQAYLSTWNHPHRALIVYALKTFNWVSLWEVGVGAGANIARIAHDMPEHFHLLGGSDINEDAIEVCKKSFTNGRFQVESVENLLMSDGSVDVMLADAVLIYIDPKKINDVIKEFTRITRNHIVLCEFHSTSWFKRLFFRIKTGYNAYNYEKLLKKHGCYDVQIIKIPKEYWPGTPWEEWGYIIIAKVTH